MGAARRIFSKWFSPLSIYFSFLVVGAYLAPTLYPLWQYAQPAPASAIIVFGVIVGVVVLAYAVVVDVWIFFGEGSVLSRWLSVLAANLIPIIGYGVGIAAVQRGWDQRKMHFGSPFDMLGCVMSQRFVVTLILIGISTVVRPTRGARIHWPGRKRRRQTNRKLQMSVGSILLWTLLAAAVFTGAKFWLDQPSPELDSILIGAAVAELVGIAMLILVLASSFAVAQRKPRRSVPLFRFGFVVSIVSAIVVAVATYVDGVSKNEILMLAGGTLFAGLGVTAVLASTVFGFRRLGFEAVRFARRAKPISFSAFVLPTCLIFLFTLVFQRFDPRIWLISDSVEIARRVQAVSNAIGTRPKIRPDSAGHDIYSFPGMRLDYRFRTFSLKNPLTSAKAIRLAIPEGGLVDVSNLELALPALRNKPLGSLTLHVDNELSPSTFEEFCDVAKVQELTIDGQASLASIRQMQKIEGLKNLRLTRRITYSRELVKALAGLPVTRLVIQIPRQLETPFDLIELEQIKSLRIVDSNITDSVVEGLNEIAIQKLSVVDCTIEKSALERFAKLHLQELRWSNDHKLDSPETLAVLGRSPHIKAISMDVLGLPQHTIGKLRALRGSWYPPDRFDEADGEAIRWPFPRDDGKNALRRWAVDFEENERGELTFLDLQWIPVDPQLIGVVTQLPALERLRLSTPGQNSKLFAAIAKNKNIKELEIPDFRIGDDSLEIIGQMRQLRRLQLPLQVGLRDYYGRCILRRPEAIPFPCLEREIDLDYIALSKQRGYEANDIHKTPTNLITESGIQYLRNLDELEYLFLPGFLLTDRTIRTIATLPKLNELHAFLATVPPSVLEQLAKLPLQRLSIGVDDPMRALKSLRRMKSLEGLQLFVFSTRISTSQLSQQKVKAAFKTELPGCEVKIAFLDSLPDKDY